MKRELNLSPSDKICGNVFQHMYVVCSYGQTEWTIEMLGHFFILEEMQADVIAGPFSEMHFSQIIYIIDYSY